ncbi:MAG: hypothetical protein GY773_33095, partial [Actinomycetia bacterium]|nr:hypothetical protein [Actinomycetes bacterium]
HGLTTGDALIYHNDANQTGNGANIGGLSDGTTYFAIVVDAQTVKLASSEANAHARVALPVTLTGTDDGMHSLYRGFDPTATDAINTSTEVIDVGFEHGLITGQPVTYSKGPASNTRIAGLTNDTQYFVVVTGDTSFKLATSAEAAVNADLTGSTTDLKNITGTGSGNGHSFRPDHFTGLLTAKNVDLLDTDGDGKVTSDDNAIGSITTVPGLLGSYASTTDNLLILAQDDTDQFSGTGAITKTISSGAGMAVSVDVISRTTEAYIGRDEYTLDDEAYTPGLGVDSDDTIVMDYDHGFSVGNQLVYTSGGDFAIGGLRDRGLYVVTAKTDDTFTIGRTQAEASATFGVSDVTTANGAMTIDLGYTHGFQHGDAVVYSEGTGSEVGGLTDGETYYVIVVDSTSIALTDRLADTLDKDRILFTPFSDIIDSQIYLGYDHGLSEGQALVYDNGGGSSIDGLKHGDVYYVELIPDETKAFKLKNAADGSTVTLNPLLATGAAHSLQPGFDPSSAVTINGTTHETDNSIDLGYEHGLMTGDTVTYDRGEDTVSLGSLVDGQRYYAVVLDGTSIALAATAEAAEASRIRYFDASAVIDNGDATNAAKFDTFEVFTGHGYQGGDTLIYFRNQGTSIGLTDGATYTVELDNLSADDQVTRFQLLDGGNNLVEVFSAGAQEFQYFVQTSNRLSLSGSSTTTDAHFFH